MNIYLNRARRHSRPAMSSRRHRNRRHDVLIMLLLGVLAVVAALVWLAEHLMVLAGAALLVGGAYYLGHAHERRRARPVIISSQPGQIRPEEPSAAGAVPAVTLPQADYDWDEPVKRHQPPSRPAGPDRDRLLATPVSGAPDLWGPHGNSSRLEESS